MQKILFLLLFLAQTSFAQDYHPFPSQQAAWEEAFIGFVGVPIESYNVMCGDTLLEGISQKKIYQMSADFNGGISDPFYMGSIYEEDKKIYWSTGNNVRLLYDFTLEEGDSFHIANNFWLKVESIEFTPINGTSRRTIRFEEYQGWPRQEIWIEGIGSNFGLFNPGTFGPDLDPFAKCFSENEVLLHNFDESVHFCDFEWTSEDCGQLISPVFDLQKNDFATLVAPNPFSEKTTISFGEQFIQKGQLSIFNLQGQVLSVKTFSGNSVDLARQNLPAGLLIYQIENEVGKRSIGKLLIQ